MDLDQIENRFRPAFVGPYNFWFQSIPTPPFLTIFLEIWLILWWIDHIFYCDQTIIRSATLLFHSFWQRLKNLGKQSYGFKLLLRDLGLLDQWNFICEWSYFVIEALFHFHLPPWCCLICYGILSSFLLIRLKLIYQAWTFTSNISTCISLT